MFLCAFDLGASSGRVMVGEYDGDTLKLSEMHRFPNEPVMMQGTLYWDVPRLFHEMKTGLRKIAAEGIPLAGIGIDTWGVDYGLLDKRGNLIGAPVHYRDSRTDGFPARSSISTNEVYASTGIQFLPFNTLFQLMADTETRPEVLEAASNLLFMPDLFTFYLTGKRINEYTIASTSQVLNAATRDWDETLTAQLSTGSLRRLFNPITSPCTVVGPLSAEILAETGLDASVRLIAVGSHDTASAVAGTPLTNGHSAYLSCGTWSLLGMELDEPCLTPESYALNFTNEGGLDGKIRYLKNINGLWMIQKLLKSYNDRTTEREPMGFGDLIRAAEGAEHTDFRVAPNDPSFNNPPDMAAAVRAYCARTGQGEPATIGETVIAVYNGLTAEYAQVLEDLERIHNVTIETLHMVGGGVRDEYLCRLTAQVTGKRIVAGPTEASALGNIVAQLIGLGAVKNLQEGRAVIARSFKPVVYQG